MPQVLIIKNISRYFHMSAEGPNCPLLGTIALHYQSALYKYRDGHVTPILKTFETLSQCYWIKSNSLLQYSWVVITCPVVSLQP